MTPSLDLQPYAGTVTIRFLDTVLASTDRALALRRQEGSDILFIPFDDIYFEFLARSDSREHCPVKGEASLWDIRAAGRAEHDAMRAYGANEVSAPLRRYGTFDPEKVTVEQAASDLPVA
jgi:uncharacterized protein (DUF427 family)